MLSETNPLNDWLEVLLPALQQSESIHLAVLSAQGELIFCNVAMQQVINKHGINSFINPSISRILELPRLNNPVFEGYITLGDYDSINFSLKSRIYFQRESFLLIAEPDAIALGEQNLQMHTLNKEVNNLQRELIQESNKLKLTLSQLIQANKKLNELNATKDKFFSIIAHDLKNPFNSLIGISKLIVKNATNFTAEKVAYLSQTLYETSTQAYQLLENLLTWSRIQREQINPNLGYYPINQIIEDVRELCSAIAEQKNIRIDFEHTDGLQVFADQSMTYTVLRNLISNALKYTAIGGQVIISVLDKDGMIQVTVADTGVGINETHLDTIFQIESKLSTLGTNNEKGTGLGLILCKEFVAKQGGKIWVESKIGQGSRFIFTLPTRSSPAVR